MHYSDKKLEIVLLKYVLKKKKSYVIPIDNIYKL